MKDFVLGAVFSLGMATALTMAIAAAAAPVAEKRRGETAISAEWCERKGGITEFRLADSARVDCLTDEWAVEHDWGYAGKQFEGIGQALFYAVETGRKPLLVLIKRRGQSDFDRHARRAILAAALAGVRVDCIWETGEEFDCTTGLPRAGIHTTRRTP